MGGAKRCQFSFTELAFFCFPHFEAISEVPYMVQRRKSSFIKLIFLIPMKRPKIGILIGFEKQIISDFLKIVIEIFCLVFPLTDFGQN